MKIRLVRDQYVGRDVDNFYVHPGVSCDHGRVVPTPYSVWYDMKHVGTQCGRGAVFILVSRDVTTFTRRPQTLPGVDEEGSEPVKNGHVSSTVP